MTSGVGPRAKPGGPPPGTDEKSQNSPGGIQPGVQPILRLPRDCVAGGAPRLLSMDATGRALRAFVAPTVPSKRDDRCSAAMSAIRHGSTCSAATPVAIAIKITVCQHGRKAHPKPMAFRYAFVVNKFLRSVGARSD